MEHRKGFVQRGVCVALVVMLMAALFFVRVAVPERLRPLVEVNYLPSGRLLGIAALGYDSLVADLLWIKSVLYFGDELKRKGNFRWVNHYFELITELNPPFEAPYEFGGIVLATQLKDVDASIALLDKGMENVSKEYERYWLLPFYQAFNYMIYRDDYKSAATFLKEAITYPQSPAFLPFLLTRLYAASDDEALGLEFLDTFQAANKDPLIDAAIQERREALKISMALSLLQARVTEFQGRFLFTPLSIDLLMILGKGAPFDDKGGAGYFIGADGIVASPRLKQRLTIHRPGNDE